MHDPEPQLCVRRFILFASYNFDFVCVARKARQSLPRGRVQRWDVQQRQPPVQETRGLVGSEGEKGQTKPSRSESENLKKACKIDKAVVEKEKNGGRE